jgi:hypothetical protein
LFSCKSLVGWIDRELICLGTFTSTGIRGIHLLRAIRHGLMKAPGTMPCSLQTHDWEPPSSVPDIDIAAMP